MKVTVRHAVPREAMLAVTIEATLAELEYLASETLSGDAQLPVRNPVAARLHKAIKKATTRLTTGEVEPVATAPEYEGKE